MKELTIEQKAQAYDEAIKRVKDIKTGKCETTFVFTEGLFEYIFPELVESEDEQHCNWILEYLYDGLRKSDERFKGQFKAAISWLEKQGSQILANSAKTCKDEQKTTDKCEGCNNAKGCVACVDGSEWAHIGEKKHADNVEPKFKVGKWIVWLNKCYKVNYNGCGYELIDQNGLSTSLEYGTVDESAHFWSIQDAKDGDVLASNSSVFIFQEEYIAEKPIAYCGIMNGRFIKGEDVCWTNERYYPATKEQRDTLFAKMADAGYTFDFEKKELKTIVTHKFEVGDVMRTLQEAADNITSGLPVVVSIDDKYYHCTNELISIKDQDKYEYPPMNRKQKPAWSEEDKIGLDDALWCCKQAASIAKDENDMGNAWYAENWLKSLKDKVQLQPKKEWSDEDEKMCQETIDWFEKKCFPYALESENPARESIKWLNSLRYKKQWKPSEEQIRALHDMNLTGNISYAGQGQVLIELYNDLKKLKG